jgi:hypothetical protein
MLDAVPRQMLRRERCCAVEILAPWRMLRCEGCVAVDDAIVDAA